MRVVYRQIDPRHSEHDSKLMKSRAWRGQSVDLRRDGTQPHVWFMESVRTKVSKRIFDAGLQTMELAKQGYVKGIGRLLTLASAEPADWFIAHTQAMLPVAAAAAARWNARLGFDCEDLLAELGTDPPDIVRFIEREFLPHCDYVSVPSQCIGQQLVRDYGIEAPLVLYNVFPLQLAKAILSPGQRPARSTLRLHWFSQTIGAGRGVEEAIEAVGLLNGNVELHLRGHVAEGFQAKIQDLTARYNLGAKVFIHSIVDHDELIQTMSEFDIGLALEQTDNSGYSQTVTNKVFSYLLAGLAIAATDTPGQREILGRIPSVGFLYQAGDPRSLAEGLQSWLDNRDALRVAQQAAWDAARRKFCWDIQGKKLLHRLDRISGKKSRSIA